MATNTLSAGLSLNGKTCIITGAASGIGEAVARIYAQNGANVAMIDFDRDRLNRVAAEIAAEGGTVLPIFADVCEEDTVRAFFKQVNDTFGSIDVVVNSAGRDSLAPPVTQVTLEEWNKTIGPNLTAVFLC
ncbi:MAG: SDR family NAD(P)-dependent oxidoreductase, partial [Gemmobacter sp.]